MCVNLTRAPSPVARPGGTHSESREEGERAPDEAWKTGGGVLEMDQDTERNAAAGKWMSTETQGK